jgi:hypothetical protein
MEANEQMFASLDLVWKPSSTSTSPPAGKAPAIIRDDPYTHVFVVEDGWADLGSEDFEAQIRTARLTGDTDDPATVDFTVTTEQDGADLRIILALTAAQTLELPKEGFWDLQQIDGGTLVAGKVKVLDDVTRVA